MLGIRSAKDPRFAHPTLLPSLPQAGPSRHREQSRRNERQCPPCFLKPISVGTGTQPAKRPEGPSPLPKARLSQLQFEASGTVEDPGALQGFFLTPRAAQRLHICIKCSILRPSALLQPEDTPWPLKARACTPKREWTANSARPPGQGLQTIMHSSSVCSLVP